MGLDQVLGRAGRGQYPGPIRCRTEPGETVEDVWQRVGCNPRPLILDADPTICQKHFDPNDDLAADGQ